MFLGLPTFGKHVYIGHNVSWFVHPWETWPGNNVFWFVHLWETWLENNVSWFVHGVSWTLNVTEALE
jgi:hypothetical protein